MIGPNVTNGPIVTIGPNMVIRKNYTIIGYNRYQGVENHGLIGKAGWCNESNDAILSNGAM